MKKSVVKPTKLAVKKSAKPKPKAQLVAKGKPQPTPIHQAMGVTTPGC